MKDTYFKGKLIQQLEMAVVTHYKDFKAVYTGFTQLKQFQLNQQNFFGEVGLHRTDLSDKSQ